MRITNNLIKEVVSTVAGDDAVVLALALKDKKNVSEFKVAEMINEQINMTRNILYRLFDHNLVHFIRKKDRKKGWYIYYWTFNMPHVKYLIQKVNKERLEHLRERLAREQSEQFYLCPNACARLDFDSAMNHEFKCPECTSLLNLHDNRRAIENIKKEIGDAEQFFIDLEEKSKVIKKAPLQKIVKKKKPEKKALPKKKVAKKKTVVKKKKPVKKKVPLKKAIPKKKKN